MIKNIKLVLERENLINLMPLFEAEKIIDEIIDTITESDLENIGVSKLGDRRRILLGFSELCGGVI